MKSTMSLHRRLLTLALAASILLSQPGLFPAPILRGGVAAAPLADPLSSLPLTMPPRAANPSAIHLPLTQPPDGSDPDLASTLSPVSLSLSATPRQISIGEEVTLSLTAVNEGEYDVQYLSVYGVLPNALELVGPLGEVDPSLRRGPV